MTTEEKAKAYDEALERARKYMVKGYDVLMPEIFPELAENEDEKIRKELIGMVKFHCADEHLGRYLNYLEKQKPAEWKPSEEQMEHLQRAINYYESDWGENKLLRSLINDLKKRM